MAEALAEGFALPPVSPARLEPATVLAFPSNERVAVEHAVEAAERAVRENRPADVLPLLAETDALSAYPELSLRALVAESWAHMTLGRLDEALRRAERARVLAERPPCDDLQRAGTLFQLGCCRLKLSQVPVATALFTTALELCARSPRPSDRLRAQLHEWRSRCHQRHREWEAARADAELALELATGIGDRRIEAHAQFQASLVAERTGQRLLARFYAEEAEARYEEVGDLLRLARILNNLGGLTFLLGEEQTALAYLERAAATAAAAGSAADGAQAASSLAQVHLRSGRPEEAERLAREALETLADRVDFLEEIVGVQVVLGRALLAQGRAEEAEAWLRRADDAAAPLGSASHRAPVWVAQGDAARERGEVERAAELYRRAAEALQDLRF